MAKTTRWRKKPVEIEAVRCDRFTTPEAVAAWCGGRAGPHPERRGCGEPMVVFIETLEGTMIAQQGDWVIKGVKGEFYPCKPDIFEATHEPADASPEPTGGEAPDARLIACTWCGHVHDPEDGRCDAHAHVGLGRCPCPGDRSAPAPTGGEVTICCRVCGMNIADPEHRRWACDAVLSQAAPRGREGDDARCPMCGGLGWTLDCNDLGKPGGRMVELIPCFYPTCNTAPQRIESLCFKDIQFETIATHPKGWIMAVKRGEPVPASSAREGSDDGDR